MKEKQGFKCGRAKELGQFYRHPQMADGYLNKCIECAKADVLQHRAANIERIRAYDRARGRLPVRKTAMRRTVKAYVKRYPKRYAAGYLLGNAVRDGRLQKPDTCQDCGIKPNVLHGHHEDYYHPLVVVWLCPPCHKARHLN